MKRLLSTFKSKWPEYLLEILVLIIGIYGAFLLDSWNENRKNAYKEISLMINLKKDFELRRRELLEFTEVRRDAFMAIRKLTLAISNQEQLPAKEQMDTCMMRILNAMTFNDQFKMLEVLFSTGMINDLKNEDLKQRLLLWPQQVEEMMEEQRARIELRFFMEPLLLEYVALREVYELVSFRGYSTPKGQPVTFKSNYAGLLSEPSFERYLAELEGLLIVNEIDSRILIENANQILNLLDQEIIK